MRLDKFLKLSRIIKRRTLAKEACDSDRVRVNGQSAKSSTKVKVGDIVAISFASGDIEYEVLELIEIQSKENALKMYRVI